MGETITWDIQYVKRPTTPGVHIECDGKDYSRFGFITLLRRSIDPWLEARGGGTLIFVPYQAPHLIPREGDIHG